MILQLFIAPAVAAAATGAAAGGTAAAGTAFFAPLLSTLASSLFGTTIQASFRPRAPRLPRGAIARTFRAGQLAQLRGERLETVTDPFTGGLVTFTSGQAPLVPQLVEEAARRREISRELRIRPLSRIVAPPLPRGVAGEVQRFFAALPTLDPLGTLEQRRAAISAIRAASVPPRPVLASRGFARGGPRFFSSRQLL